MMTRVILCALLLIAAPASASPDFVPSPRQAFEGFVAINAPRPEVPVGALWIDGYGPIGSAAAADNLETVRSLSSMVIDRNLQLSLSAGLFDLIGIDPRLRHHYSARFGDLSIVRVKDVSGLDGPKGEPRIIEALKAGTVTVSTDSEAGLNARTIGWQVRGNYGESSNGRTGSRMIEGRDLFIAIRVATQEVVSDRPRKLDVRWSAAGEGRARLDDYEIIVRQSACEPATAERVCEAPMSFGIAKLSSHPSELPTKFVEPDDEGKATVSLPVPRADGRGGLFDTLVIARARRCGKSSPSSCGKSVEAYYTGQRTKDLKSFRAKGW